MNWKKLFSIANTIFITLIASLVSGAFWASVVTGIFRYFCPFFDEEVMLLVWCPCMLLITAWGILYLPKPLRKAGLIF